MLNFPYVFGGGGQSFSFSPSTGYVLYPETVTVPNTVRVTTSNAAGFYGHSEIKHIIYESGSPITSITSSAFRGCTGLLDIVLPQSITLIDGSAFYGCSSLKHIDIPNTVTVLNSDCFRETGLEEITLPDSVSLINGAPFTGCTALKTATLSANLRQIASSSFSGCTSLKKITFKSTSPHTSYWTVTNSNNPVYKCTALEVVEVPAGWTESITLSDGGSNFTNVLTHDGLVALIDHLYDYTGDTAHTLKIGATNLGRLSAAEQQVAADKNWTLS